VAQTGALLTLGGKKTKESKKKPEKSAHGEMGGEVTIHTKRTIYLCGSLGLIMCLGWFYFCLKTLAVNRG
jgi:hypothetical protein